MIQDYDIILDISKYEKCNLCGWYHPVVDSSLYFCVQHMREHLNKMFTIIKKLQSEVEAYKKEMLRMYR